MKHFIEYGGLASAVLTVVYLIIAFLVQGYMTLGTVFMCIGGALVSGVVVVILLVIFAPGKPILEGEEDNYIKS